MAKDNKTEAPTEKKLRESREQGQFARVEEFGILFLLMSSFCWFLFSIEKHALAVADYTKYLWTHFTEFNGSETNATFILKNFLSFGTSTIIMFLLSCVMAVIIAGGIQSGFQLTPKAMRVDYNKINPIEGLKRLISVKKCVHVCTDSLKLIAVAVVIYLAFKNIRMDPVFFTPVPIERIPSLFLHIILIFLGRLILCLGIIAMITYFYERYKTYQDLKMTREEVKEEQKQMIGRPEIKMAQRRLAQKLLQKQMLDQVPTADVVITNPTHYAVALKYERKIDKAPIILAKGENLFAQHIKGIAKNYEVPIVENKLAARLLFKLGAVGKPIPVEVYEMIAEILAYVYRTHKYYFYTLKQRRQSKK